MTAPPIAKALSIATVAPRRTMLLLMPLTITGSRSTPVGAYAAVPPGRPRRPVPLERQARPLVADEHGRLEREASRRAAARCCERDNVRDLELALSVVPPGLMTEIFPSARL